VAVFESPIQAAICRRALSLSKHRHGGGVFSATFGAEPLFLMNCNIDAGVTSRAYERVVQEVHYTRAL